MDVLVFIKLDLVSAHKVKRQYCAFQITYNLLSLTCEIPEELADDQSPPLTKSSIYHIKYISIQRFTMEVD